LRRSFGLLLPQAVIENTVNTKLIINIHLIELLFILFPFH